MKVDMICNSLIVIGWHTATHSNERKKVIHLTSGTQNPVTWGEFLDYSRDAVKKAPSIKMVRPLARNPTSAKGLLGKMNHLFTKFVSHLLFAYIIDFILVLMGYKKLMVKLTFKMHRAFTVLEHFTNKEWCFHNNNYIEIHDQLSPEDQQAFFSDIRRIDWRQYAKGVYMGTRRYLLKEDDSNIEKAKNRLLLIRVTYFLFQLVFWALLWYFMISPAFTRVSDIMLNSSANKTVTILTESDSKLRFI